MAYRKIYIAVNCDSEQEVEDVQAFAKEVSALFQVKASDILKIAPVVRKNSGLILKTIRTITADGAVGVAKMIPIFMSNFKK